MLSSEEDSEDFFFQNQDELVIHLYLKEMVDYVFVISVTQWITPKSPGIIFTYLGLLIKICQFKETCILRGQNTN